MAAALLAKLLDGAILIDDFAQNFITTVNTDTQSSITSGYGTTLAEFVPFFLDYLRESTSHHLASRQSALTPKKLPVRKADRCNTPQDTPQRSSSRGLTFQSHKTPSPNPASLSSHSRRERHQGKGSPMSSPAMRPRSPMVTPGSHSNHDAGIGGKSKPNLDNFEEFPPMGLPSTPKNKKGTSRRIAPTPVKGSKSSLSLLQSEVYMVSPIEPDSPLSPASLQEERNMLKSIKSKQQRKGASPWGNRNSPSPHRTPPYASLGDFIVSPKSTSVRKSPITENDKKEGNAATTLPQSPLAIADTSVSGQNVSDGNRNSKNCSDNDISMVGGDEKLELKHNKSSENSSNAAHVQVSAELSKVTDKPKLTILAVLYVSLIQGSLVPNLTSELYFVTQLLTTRVCSQTPDSVEAEVNILYSLHNCVQFSVFVLEKLQRIISLLDKGTLRLLAENTRIAEFSPDFHNWLVKQHETHSHTKAVDVSTSSPIGGVPFSADRDNRTNFPSDRAFQNFRKQRDAFYELVREWEDSHGKPGWNMEDNMGNKIRLLVHQRSDQANYVPFARLFQSQLLQMCKGESTHDPMLANLRRTNPDKFQRLQERFVTPLSLGGPCPPPTFTEVQEFFKGFILCAESHSFSRHLMDHLILKITELNETVFPLNDPKEEACAEGSLQHKDIRQGFGTCLENLRILAKFLGFLVFEPYHGAASSTHESQIAMAVKMRDKVPQPFDVLQCIQTAYKQNRLVVTLPWVVEFLSMMDPVAPHTQYYGSTLRILFQVYRHSQEVSAKHSHLLISVCLGWLFEVLPVESLFFKSLTSEPLEQEPVSTERNMNLDSAELVEQQMIYSWYPFLGEMKTVLTDSCMGLSSKSGPVKKITPVSTEPPTKISSERRQLLSQLEENFFRIQPESLKRTSDFVIERFCSNILVHIKSVVVPTALQSGAKQVESYLASTGFPQDVNSDQAKEKCRPQVLSLIHTVTSDAVQQALKSLESRSRTCQNAFEILCPDDTNPKVLLTAARLSWRHIEEKSADWIRISLPNVVEKELFAHFDKFTNAVIHAKSKEELFNEAFKQKKDPPLPAAPLDNNNESLADNGLSVIRKLQKTLAEQTSYVTTHCSEDNRTEVESCLKEASDHVTKHKLSESELLQVGQVTVELAFMIVCRSADGLDMLGPDTMITEHLLGLWTRLKALGFSAKLGQLLSTAHVQLILAFPNIEVTWSAVAKLLMVIMSRELVLPCSVEDRFLGLLDAFKDQDESVVIAKGAAKMVLSHKTEFSSGVDFAALLAVLKKRFSTHDDVMTCVNRCLEISSESIISLPDK